MASPHQPLSEAFVASLRAEGDRALCMPEPEVARATLDHLKAKSLAALIAGLIAEHEPLLRASIDGVAVTVREVGEDTVMRFTIEIER